MIVTSAVRNSTLQHLVPNELRGRLMAAYSFVVVGLSSVIGAFIAGASRTRRRRGRSAAARRFSWSIRTSPSSGETRCADV